MADAALLAEAYRRNLLPPGKRAAYEEGVKRGLVKDDYASGKMRGVSDPVYGASTALAASIPLADEFNAGVGAVVDTVSGRGSLGENWKKNRDYQAGVESGMTERHPLVKQAATTVGYGAQAGAALMTGGATLAPEAAATTTAAKGLLPRAGRLMTGTARNATVGATYAATNAAADRGTAAERVQAAKDAVLPGAVAGVVIPAGAGTLSMTGRVAGKVGGAMGRTAARGANAAAAKTPGGAFLDPEKQVLTRLTEALQKDKLGPGQITAALDEWQRVGGPSASFMDIIAQNGGGQNTMSLIRGAAMSGAGKNVASKYGARVAADVQDTAIARTRALTADTRTLPALEADQAGKIAANSTVPEVEAGSGGRQVHQALNQSYDQAKAGVDSAYAAAREAAPEAAHLPASELPQITANLRESVRDFHPQDVPSVTRILGDLDRTSTPTMRDLFEARQHLTSLRGSPDIQGQAAGRAVRALDAEIEGAAQRGVITGDPAVVGQWRAAIAARRDFGRQFEGDDLIAQLTERTNHGGGRTTAVAPEDATNAMIGRNGVAQRPDLVRDLTRLRERLGAGSPQWTAFRQEAASRVLGRDAGSENYGQALQQFQGQSPELARLLFTPEDVAAVGAARQNIGAAVADREAVSAGQRVLSAPSDEYAVSMTGSGERRPLAQVGAARTLEGMIERPPEGATGALNRIGSSTRATNNLRMTYGDQEAADYQSAIRNTVDQVGNARTINPNTGSQTATRLADERLVEAVATLPTSKASIVARILNSFRGGATLTDEERGILVEMATSQAGPVSDRIAPMLRPPEPVRMTRPPVSTVLAVPVAQSMSQPKR